ncbi:hypothetical protein U9K52_09730 [Chryseobacterium sp. MHB01]|uniref:hypothetical protein n=1 Tax=Chryseobacterium sp. MHB01 TaxID=3109433 RepID=UPI002AFE575A|nr:hypothetical protein [Chryseobacterium sp. MHB01]MEA1849191.1 hypothetical protein [Chryseobacterium sp. MHB01]
MGIKANFKMPEVNRYINDMLDAKIQNAIRIMRVVGEDAVNEARSYTKDRDWHDVTGNLRSSIGYVITLNGRVVSEDFNLGVTNFKKDGTADNRFKAGGVANKDGKKIGRDLAIDISKALPELALVVVAGMNYAVAVESRGKNVLSSAELKAKLDLNRFLNQIA